MLHVLQYKICMVNYYVHTGFPAILENLENEFQVFHSGKVTEFEKKLQTRDKSRNFILLTFPKKKVVVTPVCCFFHNQTTY